ncbi:reverse transcriptase family protein [Ferruginibacter sp.]
MIKSLPNLYSFLKVPENDLRCIISNLSGHYTFVKQPKTKFGDFQRDHFGNIKYRDLLVPDHSLKVLQNRIRLLLDTIFLPGYMYGSVKGKNNIQNAKEHLNKQYFFSVDLKKFFPNISHHQVNTMFCSNGFSHTVARILTQLTTFKGSLPQGASTSPVIANLVFKETSNKLNVLSKENGLVFTTFLDDLTFSSDNDFKAIIPAIFEIIKKDQFYIAYEKVRYRKQYSEITGLFVKGDKLKLPYQIENKAKQGHYNLEDYKRQIDKFNSASDLKQKRPTSLLTFPLPLLDLNQRPSD